MSGRKSLVVCGVMCIVLLSIANAYIKSTSQQKSKEKSTSVVFLGDKKYDETFGQSTKSAKVFYEKYEKGVLAKRAGKYDEAIAVLTESLPYVGMGPEKAMVYSEFSEIYRAKGDLDKELFYVEQIPKYTMSTREKNECALRASEIRNLLDDKNK